MLQRIGPGSEVFRKILHLVCVMLILSLLNAFDSWYAAAAVVLAFALVIYPILALLERFPLYGKFFAERASGEVKASLILVCLMTVILTVVFWGWLGAGSKYIIVVAILAWGCGDAAAALVGKAHGRHRIEHRLVEGKKTVEGTGAMFVVSWLAIFTTTMLYDVAPWYLCFAIALLAAPVCALAELFSRRGTDTITVPLSAAASILILVSLFHSLGGAA